MVDIANEKNTWAINLTKLADICTDISNMRNWCREDPKST